MPIPTHDELRLPALKLLKEKGLLKLKEFEIPLSKNFNLTEEELNQMYESGNAKMFYDRISWALSYLNMSGLVSKPKRAYYEITEDGNKILNNPDKINEYIAEQIRIRNQDKNNLPNQNLQTENLNISISDMTPSETIELSFEKIKNKIYNDILDTIISKTPREFEKLVVTLLQKMGYGGEIQNSGEVTQYTNDNGIDGIIKEDVLGFGRIYIQAKRYQRDNKIGREDLNKFVGALAVAQSNKGVFITTSSFNKNAIEYVNKLNNSTTLVLIDGEQLAKYIYDYSLGMQTEQIIEIKKLDSDFWDVMEDDNSI
ncbi:MULTISPECIES: restriction endonuclease [Arcobacteraceae]|uniref:Mrr restriction system protein n=2 Tax=Aliarcobacter thereius TaxID=544718 RepID=A0A1C0B5A7_9BACT|nr:MULTISPECIES: restriction endonuclease [Arcobacteraceae]MDX4071638.1 restriction endonuclease [Aliarcobacter skirrowii]OCL81636.1 Mrr restriction system protein [Arcobacter porcinus]OCL90613.1 Mrr restriction system protein [Aliarcobacter thereius]OCL95620.1 Mrr restriction system protein [Aliarcobacter thereius LMG 24486]OCL97901.1 Mrr restriction system protein [Aliarcobacter thereius]